MEKIAFEHNIVFLGYGAIARATIPLVKNHFAITPSQIKVLAREKGDPAKIPFAGEFIEATLTKDNHVSVLDSVLKPGDLVVNLTAEVSSLDLIRYCSNNSILYLDTCIELWPEEISPDSRTYDEREQLLALGREISQNAPTALSSMGANPGVVSLLTKRLIQRIGKEVGATNIRPETQIEWAKLANQLEVRVIHVNERDTQFSNAAVAADDFYSTWSIPAMIVESIESAEMALGSHEILPDGAEYCGNKNKRDIYFKASGKDTKVRTWLPLAGEITAMILNHNEPYSIAELYTLSGEKNEYSPTVCFAYHPCDQAMESLKNLTVENHQNRREHLLLHDIVDGIDELGVFVMTHTHGAYWLGSRLDVHTARDINPDSSATSLQVAGGVIAGMCHVVNNPNQGLLEPEQIQEHDVLLDIAEKYWGGYVFEQSSWTPYGTTNPTAGNLEFEDFLPN